MSSSGGGKRDVLHDLSSKGLERMQQHGRVSPMDRSKPPVKENMQLVPMTSVRFSQSSLGIGFSSPDKNMQSVPLAVSLRSANPLSVMTESPGKGTPSARMIQNENEKSLTTFDHRRLVNTMLHVKTPKVQARVVDKLELPQREFGKYSTTTMGESIMMLAPGEKPDKRRDMGSLSVFTGPDQKLKLNTQRALSHMINRASLLEELTQARGNPGQIKDNDLHATRKQEYTERLESFKALHGGKLKSKL